MVAVMVASTLAFTPLPRPSESTETMRPSCFTFCERKTSPEMNWPCLARWQESTSMKLSAPVTAASGVVVVNFFGAERAHDGVENDLRIGGILAEQIGNLLHRLQVLLDDLAGAPDDLLFLKDGLGDVLEDSAHHRVRLDGEDAGVEDAALVADVVAHDIFAGVEHAAEQMGERNHRVQSAAFKVFRLLGIGGEKVAQNSHCTR